MVLALVKVLKELCLVAFNVCDIKRAFGVVDVVVVVPLREWSASSVQHIRIVSSLEREVPGEFGNFTQTIGKTFHVVASKKLLVEVEVVFTTTFLEVTVLVALHPEGEQSVEVVIISIKANIFSEVAKFLFGSVGPTITARIVSVDGVRVCFVSDAIVVTDARVN